MTEPTGSNGWTKPDPRWVHREERLEGSGMYIRIDTGPDHESALLCVDDGEPDCFDIARFHSISLAEAFLQGWRDHIAPKLPKD